MTARFRFDSTRSYLQVSGRSSLHPIDTETRGITGWIEVSPSNDGALDLAAPWQAARARREPVDVGNPSSTAS